MSEAISKMPHLPPGTKIKVGQYSTRIVKYLSEGGFSHVYITKLDIPIKGSDVAVLKRIIAPDKAALASIRTEVETMKKLRGHRHVVTYFDSHATELKNGGFEVYVLMEYCAAGGLIDFMNTRLQTRLAEWEVLKIFSDTAEAVACMHYLRPPLLHRDLKIENVLISSPDCYKLCDFGSCCEIRPAATNSHERRLLEDDISKNTTIQYRSPEMVDVSRKLPIDEKSDIWALGVMLYKLCYFTTPFETQGPVAILNAAYTFPPFPPYTDRTKRLIAVMLQENPRDRPNIYQLLAEVCDMRKTNIPIPDIYSRAANVRSRVQSQKPSNTHDIVDPLVSFDQVQEGLEIPDVQPGRRGRPLREAPVLNTRIQPQDQKRDPTDGPSQSLKAQVQNIKDDFTTKFPSLDELDSSLGPSKKDRRANSAERQLDLGLHDVIAPRESSILPVGRPYADNEKRLDLVVDDATRELSRLELAEPSLDRRSEQSQNIGLPSRLTQEARSQADQTGTVQPERSEYAGAGFTARPPVSAHIHEAVREHEERPVAKSLLAAQKASDRPYLAGKPAGWRDLAGRGAVPTAHVPNRAATNPHMPEGKSVRIRPVTVHVPSGMNVRDALVSQQPIGRPTSAADSRQAESYVDEDSDRAAEKPIRKSVSSGHHKHSKRPSLTHIGSFSGAAKTLVNGKFGDAFRKFESSGKHGKPSAAQSPQPLYVEEMDDLPDDVARHLKSTSARRSLSNGRPQGVMEKVQTAGQSPENVNIDQSSYSVKEAMRRLKEKSMQPHEVKKTATGYGKYTDMDEAPVRSATVIPTTRVSTRPSVRHKSAMQPASSKGDSSALDKDDFERRFPSLSDFTV